MIFLPSFENFLPFFFFWNFNIFFKIRRIFQDIWCKFNIILNYFVNTSSIFIKFKQSLQGIWTVLNKFYDFSTLYISNNFVNLECMVSNHFFLWKQPFSQNLKNFPSIWGNFGIIWNTFIVFIEVWKEQEQHSQISTNYVTIG